MRELSNSKTCIKCKEYFIYNMNEAWWNYKGYTPTKLIKCPECGCIQAIKYEKQKNPNYDRRYYD